jgi:REP element-mobilizing transposase RayT
MAQRNLTETTTPSTRSNFEIDTIEVDADHIHLLVSYEPHISISQIVRVLKGETTHDL